MGVFPWWIIRNIQESPTAEPENSKESHTALDTKYFDIDEVLRQAKVWRATQKEHPWYDAPAKVKVTTKNGVCHMNIELTLGLVPQGVYEMFTNPRNLSFFRYDKHGRRLLENKSTKILKKDGPRQTTEVEKALSWNFLWWSGSIPIHLIFDENHKDLTAKFTVKKMMFMKVFKGSWKVESYYIDEERLCGSNLPKSQEEYKRCSGGQGRIASKVRMEQHFEPSFLFSVPPVSWFIRAITIQTTKSLLEDLRNYVAKLLKIN